MENKVSNNLLFVIDVGNTNTVLGLYDNDTLVCSWRIRTERNSTEDEIHVLISNLFAKNHINMENVSKTII